MIDNAEDLKNKAEELVEDLIKLQQFNKSLKKDDRIIRGKYEILNKVSITQFKARFRYLLLILRLRLLDIKIDF